MEPNSPAAVTYINCFEAPAGREDDFLALFAEVNRYMRSKPGYISHRLHHATEPGAHFRFINVARWDSKQNFGAAHDDGFRRLIQQPAWADFPSTGQLVEVINEAHA